MIKITQNFFLGKSPKIISQWLGIIVLLMMTTQLSWGQSQIIGSFPAMDGGLEGQSTGGLGSTANSVSTAWRVSGTSSSRKINSTGGLSGPQVLSLNNGSKIVSPTVGTGITNGKTYQISFRCNASAANSTMNAYITYNSSNIPTSGSNFSSFITASSTANTTVLCQTSVTSNAPSGTTTAFGLQTNTSSTYLIDDFVVYESATGVDSTPPADPTSVPAAVLSSTSLSVKWGGLVNAGDGGGYVIVRSTSNAEVSLNPNGIYEVGNTSATGGGSVVGIVPGVAGTNTFSNTGLTNGTMYYYTIFAVDKAFNYSLIPATCSGAPSSSSRSILALGTLLEAVDTTYGTASATPTSFSVSGSNMNAGILVTPPSGYEVSLSSGSGYASTITVGASGTIASTPVYVRLKASAVVGSYSGNIVLSSSSATSVNVATVSSTVSKATPTLSISNSPQVYTGSTIAATVIGTGGGTVSNIKYDGSSTVPTNVGTYIVTADIATSTNYNAASNAAAGSFVINKATPTLSISNSPQIYTGSAIAATAIGTGGGAVSNVKYAGSSTVPTDAGTYAVTADIAASANYNAATTVAAGNFVISGITPTLSISNSPQNYTGSTIAATVIGTSGGTVSNIKYNNSSTIPTNAGTYTVTADIAASNNYAAATGASAGNYVINKVTSTLSITNSPKKYTGSAIAATVIGTGGGTVSNIKYDGSSTVPTNAGTYVITADIATSTNYNASSNASAGSFVINNATPTLSISNTPLIYTGSEIAAIVSATGGGAVSNVKYAGSSTVPTNAGTYAVTADVAAATNYDVATTAAAGNFVINKATPILSITNSPQIYTGSALTPTVSATGDGVVSNIRITFIYTNRTNAGSYSVTANVAATTNYNSVSFASAGNFVIDKATPTATLAVSNSPTTYSGGTKSATVGISVSSPTGGTVTTILTGGAATQTNAGTYAVTASYVPADTANYNTLTGLPAGDFIINKATSNVSVPPTASAIIYGQTLADSMLSGGTASVGGLFAFTTLSTAPNAGTASQNVTFTPNSANYATAATTASVTVNKATPNVILTVSNSPVTYSGAAQNATVSYSGSPAGVVSGILTGGAASQTNAGTYTVTADFVPTDTANYNTLTALSAGDFVIDKATQTIAFGVLASKTVGDASFALGATSATSGINAITYAITNQDVATVLGNVLTIVDAGEIAITASQAGNANYLAATDVPQTLTVVANLLPTIWTTSWSTGKPTSTKEVIIEGDYSTAVSPTGNGVFIAKKLTVNSGVLTVKSGTNLTVLNEIINNVAAANVVVENNANLIQQGMTNNNVGSITVKRDSNSLYRLDYTIWSSPVTGTQRLYDFSPLTATNRFNILNPTTNAYDVVLNNGPFLLGKGYLIRMPNEDPNNRGLTTPYYLGALNSDITYNGVFTGVPNNGDVTLTNLVGGGIYYNAIGNPYPSTILADEFLSQNAAATTGTLYFFRKRNGDAGSSYSTYNLTGSTVTVVAGSSVAPNGIIQVGQGFLVVPTTNTLSFNNTMRTADNQGQFYKTKKAVEKNRVWLNLTNTAGAFSQALVGYITNATQDVDAGIDGKYINDSKVALTSNINDEEYTIQGRALPFDASDVVPLNFKTDVAGNYTIGLDHFDGLFATGQDIYLVDSTTGTETDLKAGSYTFTATVGTANARFSLKYQKTLGVDDVSLNDNTITVYKNKGILTVNAGNVTIANVKVYDMQGRLIAEQKAVNATQTAINNVKDVNQVLIVKITSQDNTVVTKKVMN